MGARIKRMWAFILEGFALLSIEFFLITVLGLASLIGFIFISRQLLDNQLEGFDNSTTMYIRSFSSSWFRNIMHGATFLGNRQFIIFPAIGIFIYFMFIKPHRWYRIKIPVVAIGSITANLVLKELFGRERPILPHMVEVTGLSFPSGHAMFSFSFYGLLIYTAWEFSPNKFIRYLTCSLLLLLIFLIGTSRVYLGVHYPTDVLAGFAAGLFWLVICLATIKRFEHFLKIQAEKKAHKEAVEKAGVVVDVRPREAPSENKDET